MPEEKKEKKDLAIRKRGEEKEERGTSPE
jgi:hypothetical protein